MGRSSRSSVGEGRRRTGDQPDPPQVTVGGNGSAPTNEGRQARAETAIRARPRSQPTRPARRLSGRPSARARARRSRCGPRTIPRGRAARRRWAPVVPDARPPRPRYAFCLQAAGAVHQQATQPRQRTGQSSTALRTLTHTNSVTRHGDARYFRRVRWWASARAAGPVIRSAGQRRRYTSRRCSAAKTVTTPACSSTAYSTR